MLPGHHLRRQEEVKPFPRPVCETRGGECFQSLVALKGDAVSRQGNKNKTIQPVEWQGLRVDGKNGENENEGLNEQRERERERTKGWLKQMLHLHLRRNYELQGWVAQTRDGRDSWKCRGIG